MKIFFMDKSYKFIRINGEKTKDFLQGQITCDINEVTDTHSKLSAHCNPKGRVLSSFRVCKLHDAHYFFVPIDMAEQIIQRFTPYARFSKVTLEIDATLLTLGISGEDAPTELLRLFNKLPGKADEMINLNNLSLLRQNGSTPRFILIGDQHNISSLQEKYKDSLSDDTNAWELANIQAGIPTIHPQTSALFTPQMLNYPELGAVSFKKGCYIGQEVIARTHYLGKAKRHLHHGIVSAKQPPKAGNALLDIDNNEVGVIVNSAMNTDSEHYEFLAVIQDEALNKKILLNKDVIQICQV
jgi:folate-binding protein YgfZ